MATTGFGPVVNYPTIPTRQWGTFMETLPEITPGQRFPLGVKFQGFDYATLYTNDVDCLPSGMVDPRGFPAVVTQAAFSVYDAIMCSTLSKTEDELDQALMSRWDVLISQAFAREFVTSTSGAHSLAADAVSLAASSTILAAISLLEATLALNIRNAQGVIHMAPSALTYGVTNGTINLRGGTYYSPGGHLVVADAGYQATETTTSLIYATGPVWWALTSVTDYTDDAGPTAIDFTKNTVQAVREAYGLILFDPALVWKTVATKA